MAYRIQYDRVGKSGFFRGFGSKKLLIIAAIVCVLLAAAYHDFHSATQKDHATAQAFQTLVDDLTDGVALPHALEVFCRSVLEGADEPK